MAGKEIQAAADQIVVAEGHVIHLRLQAQVAQPQPTVAFRPIFKHLLHAVFQGKNGNVINGFQLRIGDDRRVRAAGRGDGFQSDLIELQTKLARQRFDLHLQVAQAIATWQSDPGGQDVKPQILLLQPAAAQPSWYSLNGSQTSLSVSPKVKCRWAGASGGLPTLRQLNCR